MQFEVEVIQVSDALRGLFLLISARSIALIRCNQNKFELIVLI